MQIDRIIQEKIENNLFKGKVMIIYGARRVGKTTLSKQILSKYTKSKYINCELLQNKIALETTNSELLLNFLGGYQLIVLDEAQYINNIGLILKIITDTFPNLQIIATGSSSFDLSNKISEPLTGRSRQFLLFPFSMIELQQKYDFIETHSKLENILRLGLYPEVFDKPIDEAKEEINNIASNYLYKDVLLFEKLKRSDLLMNLLKTIAFQIGHELSYNELATLLGENAHTIKRYIEILEKAFVLFRLFSYSRNLRKEIRKSQKIYFYDLGIRNALIQNYNPISLRNDVGGLWENFCILERKKANNNNRRFVNTYFWRTYDKKKIDYIEEKDGKLFAFEFKFNPKKTVKPSKEFLEHYSGTEFQVINNENYWSFIS
ncbi:MAG: ATP-binding protein [Bacteroidetes bacterium]|nr:ATP-binding protein [Bacteroidota bacterium]MBT6687717.1 ATP-binding protein [Bacteroidota bacterium]MBT7143689.1 ATP-binding protein [Bacteroidota bacterium]MBT7493295.1 ATP-binding protein [Bacteroidota bacterium]